MVRNLFWKKITGGLKATEVIDQQEKALIARIQLNNQSEPSPILEEYLLLKKEISSPDFIENKKKIQNTPYKDTHEFQQIKRFKKLEGDTSIKRYFQILHSPELLNYLAFKETPEFADLSDKNKVAITGKLKRLKDFENSADFKLYTRFHNSFIIEEYENLKKVVNDPEFIRSNAYWSHADRWTTTPDYDKELRFKELSNSNEVREYLSQTAEDKEMLQHTQLVLNEEFHWNSLVDSNWEAAFHYKGKELVRLHSFYNEKQANHGGKNISTRDNKLYLQTLKENVTAKTWHPEKGFIDQPFEYTSDVMQTALKFKFKEGIIKIKMRCSGKLHHAFWLGSDAKLPHINIFHFDGKNIRMENITQNEVEGITIKGIKSTDFYVYTLKWTKKELIWSVNNVDVFRSTTDVPQESMYLALNSFIPQKTAGSEGMIEVDWIRVYQS